MVHSTSYIYIPLNSHIVSISMVRLSRTVNLIISQYQSSSLAEPPDYCDKPLSKINASASKISQVSAKPQVTQGLIELASMKESEPSETSEPSYPDAPLCPILASDAHIALLKSLHMNSLTDMIVALILSKNIMVNKIALDRNHAIVSTNNSRKIEGNELKRFFDPTIKILKFSPSDDAIIVQNWNNLINRELNLVEDIAVKEIFETVYEEEDIGLKRNVIGYYLSQGLQDIRLATDVFHRARIIKCIRRQEYTPDEDDIILEFVKQEGRKFARLGNLLKRTRGSVRNRYDMLVQTGNSKDGVPYTVDDAAIIMTEVFANNKNVLSDRKVKKEVWVKIGKKIQRSPRKIRQQWRVRLEPILRRYFADNLNTDMKEILINHMVEHNMMHAQDVEWKKLAQLPKFSGCTESFLQSLHGNLKSRTNKMTGSKDATSIEIQKYLQSSSRVSPSKKREAYSKSIIEIYHSVK